MISNCSDSTFRWEEKIYRHFFNPTYPTSSVLSQFNLSLFSFWDLSAAIFYLSPTLLFEGLDLSVRLQRYFFSVFKKNTAFGGEDVVKFKKIQPWLYIYFNNFTLFNTNYPINSPVAARYRTNDLEPSTTTPAQRLLQTFHKYFRLSAPNFLIYE